METTTLRRPFSLTSSLMICLLLWSCSGTGTRESGTDGTDMEPTGSTVAIKPAVADSAGVPTVASTEDIVLIRSDRLEVVDAEKSGPEITLGREELFNSTTNTPTAEIARTGTVGGNGGVRGGRMNERSLRDGVDIGDPISGVALGSAPPASTESAQYVVMQESGAIAGREEDGGMQQEISPSPVKPFRSATASPFSTFSIDVDGGSYTNVRGYIGRGMAPRPDVVRIEELINYFTYDYPEPDDEHPFAFSTEVAPCPWDTTSRLVRIALQGERMDEDELPPANLVFLIDVSGSMSTSEKLPLLKQAFGRLIDRLLPGDRVAIVVYAGAAGLVLESTSGDKKKKIAAGLNALTSGGSTAGGAGIELAYAVAAKHFVEGGNNRVILATDGDFNVGVSDRDGLVKLIEKKREDGIFLSVLGFGYGNYQDAKMEQLADNGNGVYYYIDRLEEAERIFGEQLTGTIATIAKDVKLQIRFNPEHVAAYRLIGYENRTMAARDFANDRKDAGELGAGHSVTAFYEVIPKGTDALVEIDTSAGADYLLEDAPPDLFTSNDILLARLRYKMPDDTVSSLIEHLIRDEPKELDATDGEFRFAAAVAAWGMLLRGSSYAGSSTGAQVVQLAESGVGSDAEGLRREFLDLVREWQSSIEGVAAK